MIDPITQHIIDDQLMLKHGFSLNELETLFKKDMETLTEMTLVDKNTIVKSYKHNMKVLKRFLIDHGISITFLEAQGKKAADIIKTAQSNEKTPKVAAALVIKKVFMPTIKKAVKGAKYTEKEKENDSVILKIGKSLAVFIAVYITNSMLALIFGIPLFIVTGSPLAIALLVAVIIAPFVEEYAKRLAIVEGYPWIYTGIFAGLEGVKYVFDILAMGHSLKSALIIRSLTIIMHFTTTWIQKHYREKSNEPDHVIGGSYYVAVGLHAIWNLVGTVYNREIGILMMG